LGEKSRTPLNNAELRNVTNNSVALGPFEIWSDTTGFLHSFGSENMLPARSAIQLNHYAETESLTTEDLILVNCETHEFGSKTELTILPTDSPRLMPIGAWKQKKRILTDQNIPCFTAGTLIATRDGQKRIDDLRPGDHVITRDSDSIQVQAISQQSYSCAEKRGESVGGSSRHVQGRVPPIFGQSLFPQAPLATYVICIFRQRTG
jgi:hypothetical protein